ncbi:MAG: hypothetical protein FJ138_04895 [Deltaproteobacteria bacterium]|nr:hypothetical protein [Deltaproteobacteria bacterium]
MSDDILFNVINGDELIATLPRAQAVEQAKALSRTVGGEVKVDSTDAMVSMTFRDGMLEIFVTETRDRRSSRGRRDRDDDQSDIHEGEDQPELENDPV